MVELYLDDLKMIDSTALAKTTLGILVYCSNGGPKILSKMIPVSKLQSNFLFNQTNEANQCINGAGVQVKAIICDGNS